MFQYLFIYHRHLLKLLVILTEHGNLFYSAGPHAKLFAKGNAAKKYKEDLKKMQANGPEKVEIKTQKKFLEACVARFRPTPGFKGRTRQLWILNRWDLDLSPQAPIAGSKRLIIQCDWNNNNNLSLHWVHSNKRRSS